MLADPVVVRADIGLGVARGDLVEDVEGAHALAGGEILRDQAALGQFGDALGEALGGGAEPREVPAPGRHDDDFLALLRDGRRGQAGRGHAAERGALKKLASLHEILPAMSVADVRGSLPLAGDGGD